MPSKLDPYIHLLGTIPDADIARMAKCTNELVRQQRNKRGIVLLVDGRKRLGDRTRLSIAKQTEITRLGGKITDSEIAERLDISTATVRKYRRSSGIARAQHPQQINWTPDLIEIMGEVPDVEMARMAGCSLMAAFRKRKSLGIPMRVDNRRKAA